MLHRTDGPSIGEGVTAHTKLCEIMEAMALALASGLGSATVLARLLDTHEPLVLRAIDRATGNTALHAAVLAANVEAVQLLCVRAPSLCAVRNFSGLTARDLAFAEDFGLHYHRCTTTVAKASWVDQPSSSAGTISRALAAAASYKMIREMLKRASMPRSDSASSLAATDTEEEGEPQSIELCSLPEEMQMCIFRQLGSASDLCRLRLCCRRLREAADADMIWERLCWDTYKVQRNNHYQPWREVFVEHHVLQFAAKDSRDRDREARDLDRRSAVGLSVNPLGIEHGNNEVASPTRGSP